MRLSARKSKKFVIKLVILSAIACGIYFFINQRIKIKLKNDELDYINKQIAAEKQKSEEIRQKIDEATKEDGQEGPKVRVFENAAQ